MCLGDGHFEWTLRSDLLATWTWMSKSHQIWDLSGIISLSTVCVPFSLSSNSRNPIICRLFLWMLSHSSHRFFHTCSIIFFFVPGSVTSMVLPSKLQRLLLLLMLSVAFFILLHFNHCNLKQLIQPVNPKGNQSWIFIVRTDAEAETPILWPPDAKNWLTGKDPDAGKDWGQEEKGMTEDEMVGWHHWLNGHEFE